MRAISWTVCLLLIGAHIARADATKDPAVLDEARVLDQQGVLAYKDGRYKDAIVYFEQALKLGGPSSELWNIAKCHLKLDEPEAAHDALDAYLQREDLTVEDRDEATGTRDALDRRTSPLTVTSKPTGARVFVDGKIVGAAPITMDLQPGSHEVRVQQDGYTPYVSTTAAKFGRAIVIGADLSNGQPISVESPRRARVSIEGGVGMTLPRYAAVGGSVMPMGFVLATYSLLDAERWVFGIGLRLGMNGDAWGTSAGVSNVIPSNPSCKVPAEYAAASFLFHAVGTAAIRITPSLRAGVDVGVGLAASTAGDVGGDVFVPQCGSSPGVQPAAHFAFAASYRIVEFLRIVARPLILDLQPAYDGARFDALGAWLRYGFTVGAALDF